MAKRCTRHLCGVVVLLLLLITAGCFKPVKLSILPSNPKMDITENIQLVAEGIDASSVSRQMSNAEWSIVSGDGSLSAKKGASVVLTANKPDSLVVQCTAGKLTSRATIQVTYTPKLAEIRITPSSLSFDIGKSGQFTATGIDQYGKEITIKPTWLASGDGRAYIKQLSSRTVEIEVDTPGYYSLEVNSGNIQTKAQVNVTYIPRLVRIEVDPDNVEMQVGGESIRFRATGYDQYNNPMDIDPIWRLVGLTGEFYPDNGSYTELEPSSAGNGTLFAEQNGIKGKSNIYMRVTGNKIIDNITGWGVDTIKGLFGW